MSEQHYDAAVPALIAGRTPVVSAQLAREAEAAAIALTDLDRAMGHRVASFAPVLLRSEAASSSQIEHLTASARAIFSVQAGVKSKQNALLIAANVEALEAALALSDEISPASILSMHAVLMRSQPHHTPGQYRTEPVWIGTRSDSPVGAEYVAPDHDRVPELVQDLAEFMSTDSAPALISAAVAHAQFETIHPFSDGNGRTGRALTQAMLRQRGVTTSVAVPVSAGLLADVEGYHSALMDYRKGEVEPMVSVFVSAVHRAVANTRELVAQLDALREEWEQRLSVRRNSNAWKLLDLILQTPVLTARMAAVGIGVASVPNVYPPLRALAEAGILVSKKEYQLGPVWRSPEVLAAVDAFAARAGRRQGR